MNYRLAIIHPRSAYTADKTETIDVDVSEPISQLVVTYESVQTGVMPPTAHPDKCITKIELVDGSDVLYSLSGKEAKAADFYHNKRETPSKIIYPNDYVSSMIYNLNFGRHLYDAELALDPKRFTNLQLKVTIDIDGGGATPDAGYLTVLAHLFDEKIISPVGFLMHKLIKTYALSGNTHQYTDLPVDFPYRKLFIKSEGTDKEMDEQIANIKLSQDVDKKVIVNHTMDEIVRAIQASSPPYREWVLGGGLGSALQRNYCTPQHWVMVSLLAYALTAYAGGVAAAHVGGPSFQSTSTYNLANVQYLVEGWCPHGTVEIPFGLQDVIGDWFEVKDRVGSLKLDITAASSPASASTAEIFLQQLRRY